jgi:hypothetical protein
MHVVKYRTRAGAILDLPLHILESLAQPMSWISDHDAYLGFGAVSDSQKNSQEGLHRGMMRRKQVCYLRSGRNND